MLRSDRSQLILVSREVALVIETLKRERDKAERIGAEVEAFFVMRPRFLGAVYPAERVAGVNMRHRPLGRELHCEAAFDKARFEIATSTLHYRIGQMRLRAHRDGFLG